MNTKLLVKKLKLLLPLLGLSALLSACVTIPNTEICSVAGSMSAGGICAETLTGKTRDMTFDELLEFLEPRQNHAGAILQSASDYAKTHVALEQACRELGSRCSYEVQQVIKSSSELLNMLQRKP